MKPWIKRTLAALLGVSLLAGGLAAWGHHHYGARWGQISAEDTARWRAKLIDRAGRELQLDDAQKERLGLLFDRLDEQRRALAGTGADPRAALQQLVAGERFDRERAAALVGEKTEAVRLKSPGVIAAAADFYDALNPEQQAKLRDFLARRHGRRG
jgi:periplasmic protein CpxP/Spy